MIRPIAATLFAAAALAGAASAQQSLPPPTPLYPDAAPRSIEPEPLPPLPPASSAPPAAMPIPPPHMPPPPPPAAAAPAPPPLAPRVATGPATERVFCDQPVTISLADRSAVPDRYRPFVGIWSDAAWTPQLCAALIVHSVQSDGTASILYVYGPLGSNNRRPGGVLHGTGVIRDGELRFQNSDGTQFAFRPLFADLDGRLTTPQGQSYQAVFKKTL